jgi:hypothetical protein
VTKSGAGAKPGKGGGAARAERLEAALRANLKKRKEQVRARQRGTEAADAVAPAPTKDPDNL